MMTPRLIKRSDQTTSAPAPNERQALATFTQNARQTVERFTTAKHNSNPRQSWELLFKPAAE